MFHCRWGLRRKVQSVSGAGASHGSNTIEDGVLFMDLMAAYVMLGLETEVG